jgi:hypothetical protein
MRSSTNVSLYKIAHCNLLRSELCLPHSKDAIILSAAVSTNRLFGPVRAISRWTIEQRSKIAQLPD